jgi:Ser-tRNA(Ala) deacylase AlaX
MNSSVQSTRKMFWENPYLKELQARISSVTGDEITLDQTIFYALSGGQESDRGTISGKAVLEARKVDHQIVYRLSPEHGLKAGDEVTVSIDWDRRYQLMRLHFAAEVVLELITAKFPGIEKIGAHIAQDKARIDFRWNESLSAYLPEMREAAMKIVNADIPIVSDFSDPENGRRFWEVPGFAKVPCGGTHLRSTGEIGEITLKRDNVGKGKERVVIKVNPRVEGTG